MTFIEGIEVLIFGIAMFMVGYVVGLWADKKVT